MLKRNNSVWMNVFCLLFSTGLNHKIAFLALIGNLNLIDFGLTTLVILTETTLAVFTFKDSKYSMHGDKITNIVYDFPKTYTDNTFLKIKGCAELLNLIFTFLLIIKIWRSKHLLSTTGNG